MEQNKSIKTDVQRQKEMHAQSIKKYIEDALKATRASTTSIYSTNISDNPRPDSNLANGEKLYEALNAAHKRLFED